MLDIKLFRNDSDKIINGLKKRGENTDVVTELIGLDRRHRDVLFEHENLKMEQNSVSKQIPKLKALGEDTTEVFARMKELSDRIKELHEEERKININMKNTLLEIPNLPHESVPEGLTEQDNVEIRKCGRIPEFDFEPLAHWDIGENLNILDFKTAAKITGARFTLYRNAGARLERSVINYLLDRHTANNYSEILSPLMVHRDSMVGTGQLPKFEDDAFKIAETEFFLIPTAEVPITNMYRDEIIDGSNLPLYYCAHTACFRAEAGSAGRDTRGLIRQHQFNKVELVKFTKPADSMDELEKLTSDAESVLQDFGLPYRVVTLCGGDLGFASAKTYDIEVYMPSYGRYVEISSCSNYLDYQARRANIRFREAAGEKPQYVHTINGSGVAVGRAVAAIMENFQNADGSITVPDVLRKYMGTDVIKH